MKNHQDNTSPLPALLRAAEGVDTLETNSLCCAAAGIIAPISAAAEALIPHEKLRGAALADATLNAQERPPAQPAVGYKAQLSDHLTVLMSIKGVGRKMAERIYATGFRLTDANGVSIETQINIRPVCHIAPKDLEHLQGSLDRHAVVRTGAASKYKIPLYTLQAVSASHHSDPATTKDDNYASVAAIQFALSDEDGMTFLQLWNEGDFETIREEWPGVPEEVFIGADPLHDMEHRA